MFNTAGLCGHRLLSAVACVLMVTLVGFAGVAQAQESETDPLELLVEVNSPAVWWTEPSIGPIGFDPETIEVDAAFLQPTYAASASFTVGSTTSYGIEVTVDSDSPWVNVQMEEENAAVTSPIAVEDAFDIAVYNGDAPGEPEDQWSPFITRTNSYWSLGGTGADDRPHNTAYGSSDSGVPWREHNVIVLLVLTEQEQVVNPLFDPEDEDPVLFLGSTAAYPDDYPRFAELPSTPDDSHQVLVTVTITEEPRIVLQ